MSFLYHGIPSESGFSEPLRVARSSRSVAQPSVAMNFFSSAHSFATSQNMINDKVIFCHQSFQFCFGRTGKNYTYWKMLGWMRGRKNGGLQNLVLNILGFWLFDGHCWFFCACRKSAPTIWFLSFHLIHGRSMIHVSQCCVKPFVLFWTTYVWFTFE